MKRRLTFLVALMLLLGGCKENVGDHTTAATTAPVTEPGLYEAEHPLELQTNGALRVYPLDFAGSVSAAFMGKDLLVFSHNEEATTITRLVGSTCAMKQRVQIKQQLSLDDSSVRLTDQKFAYYDAATNELVIYDSTLEKIERVALPEGIQGKPVISHDLTTVYFSTDTQLQQYTLRNGITRLIRQQDGWTLRADDVFCGGAVLHCYIQEPDAQEYYEFVSAETGQTLAKDTRMEYKLESGQKQYALQRWEPLVTEVGFGQTEAPTKNLVLDRPDNLFTALPMGAVAAIQEEGEIVLSYYDFATGKRASEITLQGVSMPTSVTADPAGDTLWLLCKDEHENELLCRWNITAAAPGDETVYVSNHASLEAPDAQAMAACRAKADAMQEAYGVKIFYGTDFVQPSDGVLAYEYQAKAIEKGLVLLEEALKAYPEGFLKSIAQVSDSGYIHVGLVRGISGGAKAMQYWQDGNAHIAVLIDNGMAKEMSYEVCHVLDAFVNSKYGMYDTWNDLNPAGFSYYNNDTDYANHQDMTLLEGEKKAFIDLYSLSYAKEDRAAIFAHAMLADVQSQFATPVMQAKLNYMCRAIRQALAWQDDARVMPWEQYLAQPIAPQPVQ